MTVPLPGRVAQALADAPGRRAIRRSTRATSVGLALLCLAAGTGGVAVHTGNNRLFLLLAAMLALGVLDVVLGTWNLRNVTATRRLPFEAHAGRGASGTLVIENRRRALPALAVHLEDSGGVARATCAALPAGATLACPATWRFAERGEVRLAGLRLASRFPFGLLEHRVDLSRPATLVVFPSVGVARSISATRVAGGVPRPDDRRPGGIDDLLGLRAWEPGDPISRVHWPLSAKAGRPMLAIRGGEADEVVVVEVPDLPDPEAWEEALRQASGQVTHHMRLGRSVGLIVGRRAWAAARGDAHRRRLLTSLALQPHRTPRGSARAPGSWEGA
ncbi:MAG: DUF58 domain-containing protein [Deltaproteobacteria bacterium]|nr:DUF58 domain-containing protein [Deltaproteobacteria bacterium]